MAYPFCPALTFQQFCGQLITLGCKIRRGSPLVDENNQAVQSMIVERRENGRGLFCPLPDARSDEYVEFSVIRSTCAALKIDPAEFGLELG